MENTNANDSPLPTTLIEAVRYYENPDVCFQSLVKIRWPDGIVCVHCKSKENHYFMKNRKVWECKDCKKQFSIKKDTIFEGSNIKLDKWFIAIWLLSNAKNGISSCELHRSIGVTQKTAWFILQRLRLAFHTGTIETKLQGIVEADETFIGGKARNMHKDKKEKKIKGRGVSGKTIVMGLLERKGEVRTKVIGDRIRKTLHDEITDNVKEGSEVHTDDWSAYQGLPEDYVHNVVNHAERYVDGNTHTNSLENYWSLLKRTIGGTYTSVEPFHLFRYLDEQSFRFNHRKLTDGERFKVALQRISSKRLTYQTLIGERKNVKTKEEEKQDGTNDEGNQ
ncbi:MAG: IS1595 family transposase [Candidatus Kapaibacterium sp.]